MQQKYWSHDSRRPPLRKLWDEIDSGGYPEYDVLNSRFTVRIFTEAFSNV
jgi:hypothetical protein